METAFWICLFIVFYTYVGYGLLLYILVRLKESFRPPVSYPLLSREELPPLTLFITAYNEETVVNDKMRNCLELDYPPEKLRILWVTDGSDDRTNQLLAQCPQAQVLFQPQRQGKTAAMNRGMRHVETPLVVFTDANTHLNRKALLEIVHAFADPQVGCVAGEKRIKAQNKDTAAGGGEGLYWKYESALKALDSRLYSAAGAAGELFAIRRELFEPMPDDTLLDDFILSLHIVMKGYRIAYCASAYASESGSADMREEEKRKVRIAAGGLQSVWRLRALLNPLKYGIFSFQYISHRVLRWTLTPLLLFLLFPLNAWLAYATARPALYLTLLLLQVLFYIGGWGGYRLSQRQIKNKFLFIPYYFLFMNLNVIRGFRYLWKRKGQTSGVWEKAQRGRPH